MLFNSFDYMVFLPVVAAVYFLLPQSLRWLFLLLASCYFYMAFVPVYIFILLVTIVIDYTAALLIERSRGGRRRAYLILSVLSTCLVLFIFKYFDFFNANVKALAQFLHWHYPVKSLGLLLPIGLSFHTFQSLSYVVEVYRGRQKPERHFGIYALYVMFFPQLVAGPIERPQNLLHQFYERHRFDYARVTDGLKLILWGLFKKAVIADRLAVLVDAVYNNPPGFPAAAHVLATVFFAFQIYCDFSGYSDIAIGSAQVLGFKLMDNFNRPYFAKSTPEFWKRWHISLSTWFKDYVYIPLGGNRVSEGRQYFNLFVTFVISGIWHGANWTYMIWGALNGLYLIASLMGAPLRRRIAGKTGLARHPRLHKCVSVCTTFGLICFAWVFFRAKNLSDAGLIAQSFGSVLRDTLTLHFGFLAKLKYAGTWGLSNFELLVAFASLAFMEYIHLVQRHSTIRHMMRDKPLWFRWAVYYALIFAVIVLGLFDRGKFIYFQF